MTTENNENKGTDNPYYIAGSDNPNVQMTDMKMNGGNYKIWAIHMRRALSIKNKLGFITGNIPEPKEGDEKYNAWHRCNDIIIAWIFKSREQSISPNYLHATHTSDLWKQLQTNHATDNGLAKYQAFRALATCTQGEESVI